MLSSKTLILFYAICGAIIVAMLFRIWRKNLKSKANNYAEPSPKVAKASQKADINSAPGLTKDPVVAAAQVNEAASVSSNQPVGAVATVAQTASYGPTVPHYKGTDSPGTLSWDGRRLLETSGLNPRNENSLPRVLPEDVPGADQSDRMFGSLLNPAFASLVPESDERREEARKDLMAAGFYSPHSLENLGAARYAMMMLSLITFGAMLLVVPPQLEPFFVVGCILGPLVGWAFPALYIRSKAKQRRHEIERAMPDLLDMLNMCVAQGLTVPDSLQRIGRDFRAVYPALSQELSIVNEQSKISSMQMALENFGRRIDLPEVHSLTSLLIQTERMGTSISQALVTYSDTMRESQRQQADEKGNRATFRLLFPTVLCLMPAVYLFLLGPAISELQKFFYDGGIDSLNSGSQVVQRLNATRSRGQNPTSMNYRRSQRSQ